MKTMFKIELEDIKTSKIGINIMICPDENLEIVFSRDALDELFKDYEHVKQEEKLKETQNTNVVDENDPYYWSENDEAENGFKE